MTWKTGRISIWRYATRSEKQARMDLPAVTPAEYTVDLETQAIVAVSLADANEGDTSSLLWNLLLSETNLAAVATDPRA